MNNAQLNNKERIIIYLLSSLVGIIITFLSMLLTSLLMVFFEISLNLLPIISSICLIFGSFFSGFISSKKIGSRGIINGTIVAVISFLLIFIISLVVDRSGLSLNTIIHFIIILLSSIIGGIIGVNSKKKFI